METRGGRGSAQRAIERRQQRATGYGRKTKATCGRWEAADNRDGERGRLEGCQAADSVGKQRAYRGLCVNGTGNTEQRAKELTVDGASSRG